MTKEACCIFSDTEDRGFLRCVVHQTTFRSGKKCPGGGSHLAAETLLEAQARANRAQYSLEECLRVEEILVAAGIITREKLQQAHEIAREAES